MSDQSDAEILQHTTLTTDRPPYPRWDSDKPSRPASGRRTRPRPRRYRDQPYREIKGKGKAKAIPLQVWKDPEGSRKVRLSDFKTIRT